MKVFITELKRALSSLGFWVGMTGSVIAGFWGGFEFMKIAKGSMETFGEISVQAAYNAMYSNLFMMVIPILCTLPFATSFVDELNSRFIRGYLPRAGRKRYLISKSAATALSGGISVFGGLIILLLIYTILFPPSGVEQAGAMLDEYGFTYAIYFKCALLVLLGGCLWSLVGGIWAAATRNPYMAYACPFIIYYVLSSFQQRYFKAYYILNPQEWIMPGHIELAQAYTYASILLIAAGVTYAILMKRRLRDV